MASVFRKLICKELGENAYNKYFTCYQNLIKNKKYNHHELNNEEIYEDIQGKLMDKDIEVLNKMLNRLSDSMFLVLRISKTFKFTVFMYLASILFLILYGVAFALGIGAAILITGCFMYKTYEYIVNKYCFIDAHIVIIYKSVLDRLILAKNLQSLK